MSIKLIKGSRNQRIIVDFYVSSFSTYNQVLNASNGVDKSLITALSFFSIVILLDLFLIVDDFDVPFVSIWPKSYYFILICFIIYKCNTWIVDLLIYEICIIVLS